MHTLYANTTLIYIRVLNIYGFWLWTQAPIATEEHLYLQYFIGIVGSCICLYSQIIFTIPEFST